MSVFYRREPGRSLWRYFAFRFARFVSSYCYVKFFYGVKVTGQENVPSEGGVIFATNHQSYLDPVLLGCGSGVRHFGSLARESLWKNRFFGYLISTMNSIPVARGAADTKAVRSCIGVLKNGESLLIFPEGTRTKDGKVGEFKSGTMLMIKRSKAMVVPVSIAGAFDVWPRGAKKPKLFGKIAVHMGEPISAETLVGMGAEKGMQHLRDIVEANRIEIVKTLS